MSLNLKQQTFCEHYILNGNATESAKNAGYSPQTAYSQGQRLLKNVEIKKYIDDLREKASDESVADLNEVLKYFTTVMRSDNDSRKDRNKAAELLGKLLTSGEDDKEKTQQKPRLVINVEDCSNGAD